VRRGESCASSIDTVKGWSFVSQKIKAPNDKNRSFLWGIVALVVICAVVITVMVINGRKSSNGDLSAADVSFSVNAEDGVVSMRGENASDDATNVELFEDYSCHYCAQLADLDSESLQEAVENGELNVDLHTVNFVDDEKSTKGGSAALAIASSGDAGAFWGFHKKAFADQADVARNWDWEEYADAAEQLGVDSEIVDSIRDGSVEDEYRPLLESNGQDLQGRVEEPGTPALFVEGEQFPVQDPQSGEMTDWVPNVLASANTEAPSTGDPEAE
jgi:protein-disulfide isomerase